MEHISFKIGTLATYWPTSYYQEDLYIPEHQERKIAMIIDVDCSWGSETTYKVLYGKTVNWVPECHLWDVKHYELWHMKYHGK